MSDLISREALLKEINKNFSFKSVGEILYIINTAPAIEQGEPVPPIEYDADMDRYYIPMIGGWEVQTKGKGSTFRICNTKTGKRLPVLDKYLHEALEQMAKDNRHAYTAPPQPQTVKDALKKALKCTNSVGSDSRSEYDCIDEGIDFGSFEKGFSEAVDIISNRIRALIEKE